MTPATIIEMEQQAVRVLQYYKEEVEAGRQTRVNAIYFNWMARGEPLLNPYIVKDWRTLASRLYAQATRVSKGLGVSPIHFRVKFKLSTIMPKTELGHFLTVRHLNLPRQLQPIIYYSLYSMDAEFRRRWLPKAMPVLKALELLESFQMNSGKVVLHWAFIKMQNDSAEDIRQIGETVKAYRLNTRFNAVRYNPFSHQQGMESDETTIKARFDEMCQYMTIPGSKIVPRVGRDVFASCGTFVPGKMIPIKMIPNQEEHVQNPENAE